MPEILEFDWYLEEIRRAAHTLAGAAVALDAPVVTCPRWTVADLVAHQGMVHRWAAANLGRDDAPVPTKTEILNTVPRNVLIEWLHAGADELLSALRTVSADVQAMVFLNDAPAPRLFWARRQTHETRARDAANRSAL